MVEQTKYNSRQRLLATRSGLSPQWVAQANQSIGQHILQILQLKTVRCLAVYFPIRSEPDIINHYVKYTEYCQLALPVCTQSGKLSFLSWQPGQGLVSGSYNIPVPAHAEEIEPDALLLPCVGFNTMGYRLGYGGGWFDRTLETKSASLSTYGVAYNCLRDDHFPVQPHDIPLTAIVTEAGFYRPPIK